MGHDVFISYASEDESVADEISRALEAQGIRCWYAPRDIPYGSDFAEAIFDAISASRLMIVIISPDANNSRHVEREVRLASDDTNIPIIPFLIKNASLRKTFWYYIGSAHQLNASAPPLERHLEQLARQVRLRLSDAAPPEVRDGHADDAQADAPPTGESPLAVEENGQRAGENLSGAQTLRGTVEEGPRQTTPAVDERGAVRKLWRELALRLRVRMFRRLVTAAGVIALITAGLLVAYLNPRWEFFGGAATPTPTPQPAPTPEAWALKYPFKKEGNTNPSVTFLPGGKTCVVKPGDKTAKLLDIYTGKSTLLATSSLNSGGMDTKPSPDGNMLAVWDTATAAGAENRIMVWDLSTVTLKQTLPGHNSLLYSTAFSPDSRRLLSTGYDALVKLWDIQTGELKLQVPVVKVGNPDDGTGSFLTNSTFAEDGSTLAIYARGRDRTVKLYDARTGAQKRTLPPQPKPITYVSFTPNSKGIVTDDGSDLRMYDVETGVLKQTIAGNGRRSPVFGYSPDGMTIITTLPEDKTARVYDAVTGIFRYSLSGVTSARFSPDGALLVSVGEDRQTRLLDTQTGKPKSVHQGNVRFLPDGKAFVTWASGADSIRLLDGQTGEMRRAAESGGASFKDVLFAPDGRALLIIDDRAGSPAMLWNVQTGLFRQVNAADSGARRIFSPDGKTLAIWGPASGKGSPPKGKGATKGTTPTPEDPRPRQVSLWDTTTGAVQVIEGEENVREVVFSSDGGAVLVLRQTSVELWVRVNPPVGANIVG
ncbi:MAG TPA: TIR domain-containing protein [Pyrinomonadaceae bacterium]|nr:TIR domain-containing protein [Pyrinomonadaceae bacterium]